MNSKYWNTGNPPDQIMEECSEVIKIICKARRFGWHSYHPDDPKKISNWELTMGELSDLEKRIHEFRKWLQEINGTK